MFNWLNSQLPDTIETQSISGSLTVRINAINDRILYLRDAKGVVIPARTAKMG
ncbi:hypothetical protein BGZ80_006386, partial [Entomortierella chlamydospora]